MRANVKCMQADFYACRMASCAVFYGCKWCKRPCFECFLRINGLRSTVFGVVKGHISQRKRSCFAM